MPCVAIGQFDPRIKSKCFRGFRDCFHLVTFYPGPFMIRIY
jgi:hypothetical protein